MIGGGRGRYFVAALAAADGSKQLWSHERVRGVDPESPCLRTQRRWVEKAAGMLALLGDLPGRTAEVVARVLGVGGLAHEQARQACAKTRDIRVRSRAVLSILTLIAVDGSVLFRVLGSGSLAGALGPAYVWDPDRGRRLFPADGTAGPGEGRSRSPPSFEMGSPSAG